MYQLSGEALRLADHLIVIMSFVMVEMSYQSRFYTAVVKAERISFGFRLLTDKV